MIRFGRAICGDLCQAERREWWLANGRGGNLYYFGTKYDQHFGDWEVLNNLIVDGGGLDTNALFSGPSPRPLGYLLYGCQIAQPAGYCSAANAPIDVIGTGSYLPEMWSETYATADIIAYDGEPMVKAGREFLLRNRGEGDPSGG